MRDRQREIGDGADDRDEQQSTIAKIGRLMKKCDTTGPTPGMVINR